MKRTRRTKRTAKRDDLIGSLFGGSVGSAMRFAFDTIDVAWPKADRVGLADLRSLQPSEALTQVKSMKLYESHVDELCARHERGESLKPGTWAEIAARFSLTSLDAPLNALGSATYAKAFVRAFGGANIPADFNDELADMMKREPYPGAVDEEVWVLRKKLAVDR